MCCHRFIVLTWSEIVRVALLLPRCYKKYPAFRADFKIVVFAALIIFGGLYNNGVDLVSDLLFVGGCIAVGVPLAVRGGIALFFELKVL
jgi:uncharacterized membrane protein